MSRRVVVPGMGAVSPVGNSVDKVWENLVAGKSGISTITRFDVSNLHTNLPVKLKFLMPRLYLAAKRPAGWIGTLTMPWSLRDKRLKTPGCWKTG